MTNNPQFIEHNFNLPDHSEQLEKADEVIRILRNKLKYCISLKNISGDKHTLLYEEIIRILDFVGNLSSTVFNIEDEMERMYTLQFKHAPELGKKLCNDHYENIHHPYTILKNRCFKMLEDLDEEFINVHKKNPPNWKP